MPESTTINPTSRTAPNPGTGTAVGQSATQPGTRASAAVLAGDRVPAILFPAPDTTTAPRTDEPEFFRDLNLDQIVATITAGREEYDLQAFFYAPLTNLDQIAFRHEVMRDLENEKLFAALKAFSGRMHAMRESLGAEKNLQFQYQKERALLNAAAAYCAAVSGLRSDLDTSGARSRGLLAMRDFLTQYVESAAFKTLSLETGQVKEGIDNVRYCVLINETNVTVRNYDAEPDYSAEVEDAFGIFKQAAVKDYRVSFPESPGMNHVEAMILDYVAKLNPAAFAAMDAFYSKHAAFGDRAVLEFDRGIQFYLAYQEYMGVFKSVGLPFCFPTVSDTSKDTVCRRGFDLSLAHKLIAANVPPVCNDYQLTGVERMMVVTGPNQGGKTTFARGFGQHHYLASLGLPVPGSEARLFLVDRVFTHFDSEEDIKNLHGKLKDDLVRMNRILSQATAKSLVVMNELFASTSLEDAMFLGKKIMESMGQRDVIGIYVTFLDELSALNEKTVSMVAAIVPNDPTQRTFRIERKPASGLAYAIALAQKHGLTYESLKQRLSSR